MEKKLRSPAILRSFFQKTAFSYSNTYKTRMLFGQHFDGKVPKNLNHGSLRPFEHGFNKKMGCLCSKIKMTEPNKGRTVPLKTSSEERKNRSRIRRRELNISRYKKKYLEQKFSLSTTEDNVHQNVLKRLQILKRNGRSKGKEEERKGRERERKKKGKGGKEIGSEALAETEKIANAPAGNVPAGAFAIFSVSAKASLPISFPPFPFFFLSLSLPFLSSSFPFDLPFAL